MKQEKMNNIFHTKQTIDEMEKAIGKTYKN